MRWVAPLALGMFALTLTTAARAADPPDAGWFAGEPAKVTALDLHQQGVKLAEAGRWAEAAEKLAESNRLDRSFGTSLRLAECYEHLGRFASAWALLVEAAGTFEGSAEQDPRVQAAKEKADALFPRLSRLTIEVPEAARVAGLVVERDGLQIGKAQFGAAIAVDVGKHVVTATAPGKLPWQGTVVVAGEAATTTLSLPLLTDAPRETIAAPVVAPRETVVEPVAEGWPWERKAAVAAVSAGAAGLFVGAIFGGLALGRKGELDAHCHSSGDMKLCDAQGIDAYKDVQTLGNASTATLAIGGVLVATGVVLWLAAPSPKKQEARRVWIAPQIGPEAGVAAGMVW